MVLLSEKRKSQRIDSQSITVSIADGNKIFEGVIDDISTGGVKISQLSNKFSPSHQKYVSVVSGNNKNFKILLQPCWKRSIRGGQYLEVGFEIEYPPWSWTEFVRKQLPENEIEDIWGDFD
ncbi:MAG: PilZ domain-containing protein [Desulfobulbaceae bacterium]|nr:PilZ domain-containing protein [Desulfobulbaceae bacterium]